MHFSHEGWAYDSRKRYTQHQAILISRNNFATIESIKDDILRYLRVKDNFPFSVTAALGSTIGQAPRIGLIPNSPMRTVRDPSRHHSVEHGSSS